MTLACRGIRGATTVTENTRDAILSGTTELLERIVEENGIQREQLAAAIFTTTRDLNAEFPAVAARQMGWTDVALLCSHEMDVPNALPSCIRVLLLVNTTKSPQELVNLYLRGAKNLRSRGMESQ
ncbi:MAG: chorismate mutase [Chloroflexi bacterium]|nr:chorismate mutase [Chloroflexota bacterium]MCZ6789366.1 chorismate mutase [Chloroflexota bacterium]MCZ6891193.1 chorismate mutase [Chloroflexota bacterium]